MKKFYLSLMMVFGLIGLGLAQESRVWDFEDWTALPNNSPGLGEKWRGAASVVSLATDFPIGNNEFNFSSQVLKVNILADNGGFVFEQIDPAFDRSKYNAISFLIYAPGTADWKLEMMNASSGPNRHNGSITTEASSIGEWKTIRFMIPTSVPADITKYVLKPRNASAWGDFYIDDVTFENYQAPAPGAITIKNGDTPFMTGKKIKLDLGFTIADGQIEANEEVVIESSNSTILSVDPTTGILTGVGAGEATVTVKSKVDATVSASKSFSVFASKNSDTFTAFDFESNGFVPAHANYTCVIVDNPAADGVNGSSKVLSVTSNGGGWAWMNFDRPSVGVDMLNTLKFKIYSALTIDAFNVRFGCGDTYTMPKLTGGAWTEVSIDLITPKGSDQLFFIFTTDKWNTGTFFIDDIKFLAGDGSGYEKTTGIGQLTGGNISGVGGTLTLVAPEISPSNASNKQIIWSIVGSDPEKAATIDAKTGEITALLPGNVTVRATTLDLGFTAEATVVIGSATAVNEAKVDQVGLYPNPASDKVYFSGSNAVKSIRIFNLTGKLVLAQSVVDNQADISSLSKGIYMVESTSAEGAVSVVKLIVK